MNQPRFDDESLMRYADGTAVSDEVSAIEAALLGDASLVRRVAMFRQTAALAHAAMNEVLLEPVPQRLIDTVLRAPAAQKAAIDDETLMAYADGALDAAAAARVAARAAGDRDTAARIARIRLHPVLHQMPDSHAYGMARGLTAARGATIVEIETNTGVTGWGEAWGPPDFPAAYLGMVEARWRGARLTDHSALFHTLIAQNYHFGVQNGLMALLSGGSYQAFYSTLLKKTWASTTSITSLSLTIATSGSNYTVTRGSGDFLTGGIKIGDVVRITAGSVNASNLNKNLLVIGVTATVLTVTTLNSSALVAEGPISSCTIAVPGKKCWAATSSHTDDYYTFEEWFSDVSRSETWTDVKPTQVAIGLPASGNVTNDFDFIGLNRTLGSSQVLTSPTASSTASVNQAVNGKLIVNGVVVPITGAQITLMGGEKPGEAEVGSNAITDTDEGRVMVSGSFTAKFTGISLQTLYDEQTPVVLVLTAAVDSTAGSEFVTFVMPRVKISSDTRDDAEKAIVRTYNFMAEYNGSGGAALASHQTIFSTQDSLAA